MTTFVFVLMLETASIQTVSAQNAFAQSASTQSASAQGVFTQPPSIADYVVGPQDKLSITVVGIPDFTQLGLLVDNDGKISYLDLGQLQAGGKTVRQIQEEVRDLLIAKQMHRNPTVNVEVTDFRSQMVYVSGAVSHAMGYKIIGNDTLMNVLAQAGFAPTAGQKVQVVRNKPTHLEFTFDRRAIENGTAPSFQLQDGDSIIVPDAEKALVRGEVKSPGLFEVTPDTSVLQLIVMAGDFNDRAARGSVKIIRKEANGRPLADLTVKARDFATTIVKPGDVIEVKRRIL